MAIIYTYPTVTPTANDLVLLTDTSDSQKATKSATIASVIGLGTAEVYDLQKTLDNGTISTGSDNAVASINYEIDVTCSGISLSSDKNIGISATGSAGIRLVSGTGPLSDITFNGTSAVKMKKVGLNNINLQALNVTPIELVAAPGAGQAIQVLSIYGFLDYTAPAFAAEDLRIRSFGSSSYLGEFDTPFTSASADKREVWKVLSPGSWIDNAKLEIYATGALGGGGSTLTLFITYLVIDTGA